MRNALFLFFLLSSGLCGWSQVSMTLQVPPAGVLLKPQLWNMAFTNTASSRQIEIGLVLTDMSTGQVALTGTTDIVVLNNGTKQITGSDVNAEYEYPSSLISDHDPNGYLAIGTFNACYTVYDKTTSHDEVMLDQCTDVIVEPVSPPLLNMPCDGCYAESSAPLFTWLPPAPLNLFSNLTYEMKLVEVAQGQASSEAIQINAPILLDDGNTNPFLNYPGSGALLDTSKTYAWQVIAKNNNDEASQSEIWTFKLKTDTVALNVLSKNPYVRLRQTITSAATFCDGNLNFVYNNEKSDSTVLFSIYSLSDDELYATVKTGQLTLKEGDNYLSILLFDDKRFANDNTYLFELTNREGEKWKMKFMLELPQ